MIDEAMVLANNDKEIYFLIKEGYITKNKLIGIKKEILRLAKEKKMDISKLENLFDVML